MAEIHFNPWKVPKADTPLYKIKINKKTKQNKKQGFVKKKSKSIPRK